MTDPQLFADPPPPAQRLTQLQDGTVVCVTCHATAAPGGVLEHASHCAHSKVRRDPVETEARAQEGMARADEHNAEWRTRFDRAIQACASRLALFTADDVWTQVGDVPDRHGAASALGPAMRRAVKAGLIEQTGNARKSERPVTHGKWLPVWRSLTHVTQASHVTDVSTGGLL